VKNWATIETDVLVIGAGLTGLRAASAASRLGASVLLVGKCKSASPDIMGFNAAVQAEDSTVCYYRDVRVSGAWLNDRAISEQLVGGVTAEIRLLEELGLGFDKNADGSYHTIMTLGCTYPRLVHAGALTGVKAMRLLEADAARLGAARRDMMVLELLLDGSNLAGAVAFDLPSGEYRLIRTKAAVLAAGGCGRIYRRTTYPPGIGGDSYALAYRAGARLTDMEFQQYEPCCFVYPEELAGNLLPTTLLRAGARLQNNRGEDVLERYGMRIDSLQKGELAQAMAAEIAAGRGTEHGGLYYDVSILPRDLLVRDHSIFYETPLKAGIDLTTALAEVAPCAHTCLGGVQITADTDTGINGLYAAGEAVGGVHGANRIGGCAGAETLVFGGLAGARAARRAATDGFVCSPEKLTGLAKGSTDEAERLLGRSVGEAPGAIHRELGDIMTEHAGLVRSQSGLEQAAVAVAGLEDRLAHSRLGSRADIPLYHSCVNMLTVAQMQVASSHYRKKSLGVYSRADSVDAAAATRYNTVLQRQDGVMRVTTVSRFD
jgi:succinate dehydrogenase/fumarate reductase flavoprotein subunit